MSLVCAKTLNKQKPEWLLVLNYLHKGGTNPSLVIRSTLPVQKSTVLGTDESNDASAWGHASLALMSSLTFSQIRFYARTSAHSRVINFTTTDSGAISYFKTGAGNAYGIRTNHTLLSGHTANLPAAMNMYHDNSGALAMTDFPFYRSGTYHWGLHNGYGRWEVDDYPNGSNTHHQIWVK
jgi:hypothetical protein